jgi:hypothetical protein
MEQRHILSFVWVSALNFLSVCEREQAGGRKSTHVHVRTDVGIHTHVHAYECLGLGLKFNPHTQF